MRYFEVINIDYKHAQTFVDGIRLFANSKIKHKAHVTIKGPSQSTIVPERIKYENQIIKINGIGNFFSENQNTVFLKCGLDDRLKKLINKPDFGNENPHITLYDGDDKDFANKLFQLGQNYSIKFQFIVNVLDIISSNKDYLTYDKDFFTHLSYYINETVNQEIIENLSIEQRLFYIEKLFDLFKNWENENVIANPCIKIIKKLKFLEDNGLFYYDDIDKWKNLFPYRVIQAIHQIKPYAFFSIHDIADKKRYDYNLPFVFIFSDPSEEEEKKIKRDVFNFGNAPIVIIHYRSTVKIFNGLFLKGTYDDPELELIGSEDDISNFSYEKIITQEFWDEHLNKKSCKNIYNSFLSNLSEIRKYLISIDLSGAICNRLIGRLLFIRYFIDRGVAFIDKDGKSRFFSEDIIKARIEYSELINNKENLYNFFTFFRNKYNGDLFPIYDEELSSVKHIHLSLISELFRGGEFSVFDNKISLQKSLFDVYDFSIIPIELVSNVYERFMGEKQNENKAFYTPYFLADFVLENTIGKFLNSKNNDDDFCCPVLDPSCGSGIFLVEALRKIIEKKIIIKGRALENQELWQCVLENIYGIDIDSDAIDIATFSIYVTILDYIEPKEISNHFKFINLKGSNFFPEADFFDTNHSYNKILKTIKIKYIIGNPPWGHIKKSPYMNYCSTREKEENETIGISDYQIAQAFLIRVSDFFSEATECSFVVTSKVLYNSNAKSWRKYFFKKFFVREIYDFSPVRTSLFEGAFWPAMIVFYSNKESANFSFYSVCTKEFFKRFNSFVINPQSVKVFSRSTLLVLNNRFDWFWKVILYGTYFDYLIIKRLKQKNKTILEQIDALQLNYGVGLKRMDGAKVSDSKNLIGYKFIDTGKKDLHQFNYNSTNLWTAPTAGNIPNDRDCNGFPILFKAPVALIKEGLTPDIKGVAAFCTENVIFTHSIRAIKGTEKDINVLKSIVGLINSNLFSYYILHTGSSVGVDLTRANQIEQFSFPAILSDEISVFVDKISSINEILLNSQNREELMISLNNEVMRLYQFSNIEKDFIDYTINFIIPSLKITRTKIIDNQNKLEKYYNVFESFFISESIGYDISFFKNQNFVGVVFKKNYNSNVEYKEIEGKNIEAIIRHYSKLTIEQISKKVFLQKNIIENNPGNDSYCIIKSNHIENWQSANAWLDLSEFIKNTKSPDKDLYEIYEEIFNYYTEDN